MTSHPWANGGRDSGDLARLLARASANGGHGNDRPTRDLVGLTTLGQPRLSEGAQPYPITGGCDVIAALPITKDSTWCCPTLEAALDPAPTPTPDRSPFSRLSPCGRWGVT